jgi:hypothetical protein
VLAHLANADVDSLACDAVLEVAVHGELLVESADDV